MCINKRWVYNKYVGKSILVDCGYCEDCRQAHGNRVAMRINNHGHVGFVPLFVHLTYAPPYVPYIKRSELVPLETINDLDLQEQVYSVNIYRKTNVFTYRYYKKDDKKFHSTTYEFPQETILSVESDKSSSRFYYKPLLKKYYDRLYKLRGDSDKDKVAVIFFKDLQDFIKRLRQKVQRSDFVDNKFFDFHEVSEYGGKYKRCHFHLLLWVPEIFVDWYKDAIASTWSFALYSITFNKIEKARCAAKYVSTYLNKHSNFLGVFQSCDLLHRERFGHSKNFGFNNKYFELSSILQNLDRKSVTYRSLCSVGFKSYDWCDVPLPTYVFTRYFPINFKGIGRFTYNEIFDIISNPFRWWFYTFKDDKRFEYKEIIDDYIIKKNVVYGKNYIYELPLRIKRKSHITKFLYGETLEDICSWFAKFYVTWLNKLKYFSSVYELQKFKNLSYKGSCTITHLFKDTQGINVFKFGRLYNFEFAHYCICLLRFLWSYRWHTLFAKVVNPLDNLQIYDNLDKLKILPEWLFNLVNANNLVLSDYSANKNIERLGHHYKLSIDFKKYSLKHKINDFLYNEY